MRDVSSDNAAAAEDGDSRPLQDISDMEPDDEPVIGNPMQGKSRTTYTPPPARASSPDTRDRKLRNSRYSVDGVIDKQVRATAVLHVLRVLCSPICAMFCTNPPPFSCSADAEIGGR